MFLKIKKGVSLIGSILFFLLYFLIFSVFLYSYYDLNFSSQDELDYYYETGQIDKSVYDQYSDNFNFSENSENTEAGTDTEKPEYKKVEKSKKFRLKTGVELDDYKEKTNDISSYLRMEYKSKNWDFGVLGIDRNKVVRNFSAEENFFVESKVEKQLRLEKFYAAYSNSKIVDKLIVGDFKARFAMGLTFSRTNLTKDGLFGDLEQPFKRTFDYQNGSKKEAIDNTYLHGIGLHEKIKNFEVYYLHSNLKNPLDNISVRNFDNQIEKKTVNGLDDETIQAGYIGYNFLNFAKIGGIFYNLQNEYFNHILANKNQSGKGLYFELNSNNFFYQNELSFVDDQQAFINKFGFDNKNDLNFFVSYRDYPAKYQNQLADSLSLHPSQDYFRCTDEQGFRFYFNYFYYLNSQNNQKKLSKQKLEFEFQSDIFKYTKKADWNSQTQNYDIFYYPAILSKTYFLNTKYFEQNMIYSAGYRFYDRDTNVISSSYYQRKDEYFDWKIEYDSKEFECSAKYTKKVRGIDVPGYTYFSEYFALTTKTSVYNETYLGVQINFLDTYMDKISDDTFSYIFTLNSKLNKNLQMKVKWYVRDDLKKKYFDLMDDDGTSQKVYFYDNGLLNRWSVDLEWKF